MFKWFKDLIYSSSVYNTTTIDTQDNSMPANSSSTSSSSFTLIPPRLITSANSGVNQYLQNLQSMQQAGASNTIIWGQNSVNSNGIYGINGGIYGSNHNPEVNTLPTDCNDWNEFLERYSDNLIIDNPFTVPKYRFTLDFLIKQLKNKEFNNKVNYILNEE